MTNFIFHTLISGQFLFIAMIAIMTAATIITFGLSFVDGDVLNKRMKAVSSEREAIRPASASASTRRRRCARNRPLT